jgi:hypothetical protein
MSTTLPTSVPIAGEPAATTAGHLAQHLAELRAAVRGTLHTQADPTWDAVRTPWVVNIEQRPLAVLEVADTDDVVTAVRWAAVHRVPVSAQPVGHGATHAQDGVLLLRTRALRSLSIDIRRRIAWVEAGVKAGELLTALDGTGLTFLAGSNPDPTVVGMTITGGISWFGRAYGLGCDSIRTVELVDGAGRLRTLGADSSGEDAELFWALRGGGGDFGVITRVELDLHPAPQVYGGRLLWPIDRIAEVLQAFAQVTAAAPPELTTWFHAYRFPPLPEVPDAVRGKAFASLAVTYLGAAREAEALLAPFRAVPDLVLDLVGDVPLSTLGAVADEPTDPMPTMETGGLLDRLDDELVERLVDVAGPESGCPLTVLAVRHLGGAFAEHRNDGGCHGAIPEPYTWFALGVPASAEVATAVEGTFLQLRDAVAGHTSGRGLLNFLGAHGDPGRWWSPATRERLVAAKEAADPWGLVRSNRPVRPAALTRDR